MSQMMPLFGFPKERLNPDHPLAHRFLVALGLDIVPSTIQDFLKGEALDHSSIASGRTLRFHGAALADFGRCPVDRGSLSSVRAGTRQSLSLRAEITILLGVIGETALRVDARA